MYIGDDNNKQFIHFYSKRKWVFNISYGYLLTSLLFVIEQEILVSDVLQYQIVFFPLREFV